MENVKNRDGDNLTHQTVSLVNQGQNLGLQKSNGTKCSSGKMPASSESFSQATSDFLDGKSERLNI